MRLWTARHWAVATVTATLVGLLTGTMTALVPNSAFSRMIDAPWWAYPVWIIGTVLTGLLIATYVPFAGQPATATDETRNEGAQRGFAGSVLSFLAVGCPTCNKLVVLALGTSGAVTWFEPVQPVLAVGSVGLLGFALRARMRTARSCPSPVQPVDSGVGH